jgi:hypothetical protein
MMGITVHELLEKRGMILDTDRYADQSYPSIHIGEVIFPTVQTMRAVFPRLV